MDAESREAVFAALRAKGIKAIKVVAADGSKANGEIRGVRKRVLIASVLAAAVLAGVLVYGLSFRATPDMTRSDGRVPAVSAAQPLPRQEIKGDRARIDGAAEAVFALKAERFLARFAEPGRDGRRAEGFVSESEWPSKAEFEAAFTNRITIAEDDFTEHIDLKRIVTGMKREMEMYLRLGGYVSGYIRELIRRQQTEIDIRAKFEKKCTTYDNWVKANAQLQSMGIYPIPQPAGLRAPAPQIDLDE